MHIRPIVLLCLVGACASPPAAPPPDPCIAKPVVPGGMAEVGSESATTGADFPVIDGQDAAVRLGYHQFWMFTVNARVKGMDVGAGDLGGVISFTAFDQADNPISLDVGCRVRDFSATGDGYSQLTDIFNVALSPDATPMLDGAAIRITVDIVDHDGRRATDDRTVTARLVY